MEKKQATAPLGDKEKTVMEKAKKDYQANKDGKSIMGLDQPMFKLRNPGIVSIPIGFMTAILLALLFPNKNEADKFDEMYVRQTTGLGMPDRVRRT